MAKDKIEIKEVEFVPGLLKLMRELLDNSVDEFLRTSGNMPIKLKLL